MSCATCYKNEICLINQDTLHDNRTGCPHEAAKGCGNCMRADSCPKAKEHGYCKDYRNKFSKTIMFGGGKS